LENVQRVADALVWHRNPQKRGKKEKGEKHIIKIKGQTAVLHAWKAMHVCVCADQTVWLQGYNGEQYGEIPKP